MLRPVLEAESLVWRERLNWDYLASAKLLLQYLDSRSLPGYVAVDSGKVTGYIFCVYEDSKAVIGDVFALPEGLPGRLAGEASGFLLGDRSAGAKSKKACCKDCWNCCCTPRCRPHRNPSFCFTGMGSIPRHFGGRALRSIGACICVWPD